MIIAAIFAAFWALYSFTLPHQYTYDGLCYALDAERGPLTNLFHPGHLLYSGVSRLLWKASGVLGYHGQAIYLMQVLNAMIAAGAVALLAALFLRRTTKEEAILWSTLFGLSYAFWSEAADPGCYAWAGLASVALLWLLVEGPSHRPFLVGLAHGFLVLWHQMLILVAPAFLWKKRSNVPSIGWYLAGLTLAAAGPYALVASIFHNGSLNEALYWALGPAGPPPGTPILSAYWWSLDLWRNAVSFVSTLADSLVYRNSMSYLLAAVVVWAAIRRGQEKSLWIWILCLSAFQFFFSTGAPRFRILLLPPLLYLALPAKGKTFLHPKGHIVSWGATFLALTIIGSINFVQAIRSRAHFPADHLRTAWVKQIVGPQDFLIYRGRGEESILNVYLVYFAPQVPSRSISGYLFSKPSGEWDEMNAVLEHVRARGGRIFIEESLPTPGVLSVLSKEHNISQDHLRGWLEGFKKEKVFEGPNGYKLFQAK